MVKNSFLARAATLSSGALLAACAKAAPVPMDSFQGVVELEETVLAFEVGGRLQTLNVEEGDRIEAGAVIGSLDDSLARATRSARALEASAARSESELVSAGARREDVNALRARVRAAEATEATLEKNLARERQLLEQNVVPAASFDEAEGAYARARAERESLQAALAALVHGARREERQSAASRAEAAAAGLAFEDERLERHILHAPISGRVLDKHVEPGEVVAAGTPIATLGDTRRPYVEVFVPQANLRGIDAGDRAEVRVDAEPQPLGGRVEHIARRTEFTPRYLFSERERPNLVVRVRVRVDDPSERLHIGVPAFVTIHRASSGAER